MLRQSRKAERKLFVSAIYIFDYKIYVFRKNVRDYVIFFFYHISPRLPAKAFKKFMLNVADKAMIICNILIS